MLIKNLSKTKEINSNYFDANTLSDKYLAENIIKNLKIFNKNNITNTNSIKTNNPIEDDIAKKCVDGLRGTLILYNTKFSKHRLSTRLINVLTLNQIYTVGDIFKYSKDDLNGLPYFGIKCFNELINFLSKNNIKLSYKGKFVLEEKCQTIPNYVLNITFAESNISNKLLNVLQKYHIANIQDVLEYSKKELIKLKGFCHKYFFELNNFIEKYNVKLDIPYTVVYRNIALNTQNEICQQIPSSILNISFQNTNLSNRLINVLIKHHIFKIKDIIKYSEHTLMSFSSLGQICIDELKRFLLGYNITLPVLYYTAINDTQTNTQVDFVSYIRYIYNNKISDMIISYFGGETLESIGKRYKVTRERVRQICNKLNIHQIEKVLYEDKYKDIFHNYEWDKITFCKVMNENTITYQYLLKRYGIGRNKLDNILHDPFFSKEQQMIYISLKKMAFNTEGEILSKDNFFKTVVVKYALDEISIKHLAKRYSEELLKYPELKLKPLTESYLKLLQNTSNYICSCAHNSLRYYELESVSKGMLRKILPTESGFYSTEYLFQNNIKLMRELDIRNKYELHSILKFKFNNDKNANIIFLRMPNILIKYKNKETFILDKIKEYSPISIIKLANILKTDYGHDKPTISTYLSYNFSKYLRSDGNLNIEIKTLSDKQIDLLKTYLTKDIYLMDELNKIISNLNYTASDVINKHNCDKLGYRLESNYIMSKRFRSIPSYLDYLIQKNDVIKIDDEYIKLQGFYFQINNYLSEYKLFKLDETNTYITKKNLEALNIKNVDLQNLFSTIKKSFENKNFFSVYNLLDEFDYSKFENVGLSETFLENILNSMPNLSSMRICNNKLFSLKLQKITIDNFVDYLINKYSAITLTDLKNEITKLYKIQIPIEELHAFVYRINNIFYSNILDKIYTNKKDYYTEVFDEQ